METTIIRNANLEDCERIFVLLQAFRRYENRLHLLTITLEDFKNDGFGKEKLFHCIVAETNVAGTEPNIIGYALFCYEYSAKSGKIIFLEDLFVQEPYRGNGIGTKLFKILANIAVQNGAKTIRWPVICRPWNKNAMKFYKKFRAEDMSDRDVHLFQIEGNALEELTYM